MTNLEEFIDVIPNIVILKFGIELSELGVVNIFEYQRWRLALRPSQFNLCKQHGQSDLIISDNIKQGDDVRPARQVLQDLDLSLDLLLFHRFEHLDDALLVVDDINALKDF